MPTTFPLDTQAQFVGGAEDDERTVANGGPGTVYYANERTVSSLLNDGSIASGASKTFWTPTWLVTGSTSARVTVEDDALPSDLQQPSGNGKQFSLYFADALFNGTTDPVSYWGYNIKGAGKRTSGENSLWLGMEGDYNSGSARLAELNLDYLSAAAGGTLSRFLAFSVDRSTNKGAWSFLANAAGGFKIEGVTNDSQFTFVPKDGTAAQVQFKMSGGSGADFQMGLDGGAEAPTSMSFGPSALSDYQGIVIFNDSGRVALNGTSSAPASQFQVTANYHARAAAIFKLAASQSVKAFEIQDSAAAFLSGADKAGRLMTAVASMPADADIADGQGHLSIDTTTGELKWKSKTSGGTVKTGTLAVV